MLFAACADAPSTTPDTATTADSTGIAPADSNVALGEPSGIAFDPSTIERGDSVGTLVLDSISARQAMDSTYVGSAWFSGELQLSGTTIRHFDADAAPTASCFEADAASAARLPRWRHDERRAWFCFDNPSDAVAALGTPGDGVRMAIVVNRFTIHRNLSDAVNEARFVRRVE